MQPKILKKKKVWRHQASEPHPALTVLLEDEHFQQHQEMCHSAFIAFPNQLTLHSS